MRTPKLTAITAVIFGLIAALGTVAPSTLTSASKLLTVADTVIYQNVVAAAPTQGEMQPDQRAYEM
jgi:hypothetical protein